MSSRLTILLYHGVTDHKSSGIENISKKHIDVKEYFLQMSWLKENAHIISMDKVVEHYIYNIPFPDHSVAITFDDGFENNFLQALPVIQELDIPTTFYISSGLIGTKNMFWVDQLEDCINLSKEKELKLLVNNNEVILDLSDIPKKIGSLKQIKAICKDASNNLKIEIIKQVISCSGVTPSTEHCPNYKVMDWSQLKIMSLDKNVIIGGHSLNHEILSKLSVEDMKLNIGESINLLEKNLLQEIKHYSYPEGQENHYNKSVIDSLKEFKIQCSPSARHGTNSEHNDLFNLYRVMVGFDGISFPYEVIKEGVTL